MTLLEAFRVIGPYPDDDAQERARREEASRIVYEALTRLVERTRFSRSASGDERADAVTNVFMRMYNAGPRGTREADPTDERGVTGWLKRSLGRALLDQIKSRPRESVPLSDAEEGGQADPADRDLLLAIASAERRLFVEIVPGIASRLQEGNSFAPSITTMRKIKAREMTMAEAIDEEAGGERSEQKRAENRLHKRFQRALDTLNAEIDRIEADGEAEPDEVDLLRRFANDLRLRS